VTTASFLAILGDDRVAIRRGAATHLVRPADIRAARSEGNYTVLDTSAGTYRVRASLRRLVAELGRFGFVRIHRRGAANLQCIRCVEGRGGHRLVIVLDDGSEMDVGRNHQPVIRRMCGAARVNESTRPMPGQVSSGV
jgi:two-component system, LytTR family, response regulator LytT